MMDAAHLPGTGDIFVGRYRIGPPIGKGGFSWVFRAVDANGRDVALKILLPETDGEGARLHYPDDLEDRFLREARLLEQLVDPHTIQMYDHGRSEQGLLYMVFEFIEGRSLHEIIRDEGPQPPERVFDVLQQTLLGLEAAHGLGILHRDIKPNNIMVFTGPDGMERVKLLDFGIAKRFGEAKATPGNDLTAAGLLVGTPRYMSPEQLRNEPLGPACDLYSLGLVAIEMLTARKIIAERDRLKILEAQLKAESFRIPPEVEVPARMREIIHRMTEKNVRARYARAAQVLHDLRPLDPETSTGGFSASPDEQTMYDPVPAALTGMTSAPPPRGEEETVMQRVKVSELEALANQETVSSNFRAQDLDPTVADHSPDLDATVQARPGQMPSGQHDVHSPPPSTPGYYDSPSQQFPSSQFGGPSPHGAPSEASYRTTHNPHATMPPGQVRQPTGDLPAPGAPEGKLSRSAPKLEQNEILALVVSFFLPGLGHVILGQTAKGLAIFAAIVLTMGVGYLVALAIVADAYLVIRASRRREVAPFEFFPEWRDFLT